MTERTSHSECARSTEVVALKLQVAGIDQKVRTVEKGLRREQIDRESADQKHLELLQEIKNKNHIEDFVRNNWKWMIILYIISTREDAEAILQGLYKFLT